MKPRPASCVTVLLTVGTPGLVCPGIPLSPYPEKVLGPFALFKSGSLPDERSLPSCVWCFCLFACCVNIPASLPPGLDLFRIAHVTIWFLSLTWSVAPSQHAGPSWPALHRPSPPPARSRPPPCPASRRGRTYAACPPSAPRDSVHRRTPAVSWSRENV